MVNRREFLKLSAVSAAGFAFGCNAPGGPSADGRNARLASRPGSTSLSLPTGLQILGLGSSRDGRLFIPSNPLAGETFPLVVLLHGAGQSSVMWFGSYTARAEAARVVVLAIDSRGGTWDAITEVYGPDVTFIDGALAHVFSHVPIDSKKMALAGFSDGASYALGVGLTNGDLFDHVIAYSPGFVTGADAHGKPKVFISHGVNDQILPINSTSRVIVPNLQSAGYQTKFVEFTGTHEVPPEISDAAFAWLAADWQ